MTGQAIAMWSGPRNISTAMMRAWENRSDTQVIDEPFYAHYLKNTGLDHPMADAIIEQGETDWQAVVKRITTVPADGIIYQKHITAHWLDHYSTQWLDALSHVFLIRHPEPVVASYNHKRESISALDLGYAQQSTLFDIVSNTTGKTPLVIDSYRFLTDPERQLRTVCEALDIEFEKNMLNWPSGTRPSDGVWSKHWYDAVNKSTGFMAPRFGVPDLDEHQQAIVAQCQPYYNELRKFAI